MAKTFKELQDEVLQWMGDEGDEGLMRDLIKQAMNKIQDQVLTANQFDFMLWPTVEQINVIAGQKQYALHPLYLQGLFFYNPSTDEYLEEIPIKALMESDEDWDDGNVEMPDRFHILSNMNVAAQPTSAGVVTVATDAVGEVTSSQIIIRGIDSNGEYAEETLSDGSTWTTLTGSTSFRNILDVVKNGTLWVGKITITVGSTTILTLGQSERGKQYRLFELAQEPGSSFTIKYRFYRKPSALEYDYQIPDIPEPFTQILVWNTLLMLVGYTRATPQEVKMWEQWAGQLDAQMKATLTQSRALGGRARYVKYIERL